MNKVVRSGWIWI